MASTPYQRRSSPPPIRRQRKCPWHMEVEVSQQASITAVRQQWQQQVVASSTSSTSSSSISPPLHSLLRSGNDKIGNESLALLPDNLRQSCISVRVERDDDGDDSGAGNSAGIDGSLKGSNIQVHTFCLNHEEACIEELDPASGGVGDDEWTAGCDNLTLPHSSLHGLWENLIFDASLKRQILDYASTALLFADRNVSSNIVNWNRILMLHGKPGNGKTSLCRALAHKLSIRLGHRFPRASLLEIHSHSLFSKWFSTSGKLVSALFTMVRDMVEDDPTTLVFVLVDEVESLAATRGGGTNGDPADATRAVNALLTSLDRLRAFQMC
jgi:ATPase family associated with various cellular activities (AAA)